MSTNWSLVVPFGKLVLWAFSFMLKESNVKIPKESKPIHSKIDGRKITSPGHRIVLGGSSQLFPFQMTQMATIHGLLDDPHGRGSPFLSTYKKGILRNFHWLVAGCWSKNSHGMAAWHTHLRLRLWRCTSHPTWQVKITAYKDPGEDLLRFSHLLGFQCLFTTWQSPIYHSLPYLFVFHRNKNRKVLWNLIGAKHPKFCGLKPKNLTNLMNLSLMVFNHTLDIQSYLSYLLRWFRGPVFGWYKFVRACSHTGCLSFTLWQTNIAMENGPFEDVFPVENGDFP